MNRSSTVAGGHTLGRTLLLAALAVVLVAAGAGGGWWWARRADAATVATARTELVAATVGTVSQTVAATGTIEPAHEATVSFQTSGTVTSVKVTAGDRVTAGETLATLDPTTLQNAVALAAASVTAAQSQAASATTTATAQAQAQLASAEQQLSQAKANLVAATLTAPISGIISNVGLSVGSTVGSSSSSSLGASGSGSSGASGSNGGTGFSGSSSSGGGTGSGSSSGTSSSIVIVDPTSWVVNATVGAGELGRLKKNLQATMTAQGATPSTAIFGTVSSVGIVATSSSSGSAVFPVTIAVTGDPPGIYAGTSVDVAITTKVLPNVLTIPTAALSSAGGQIVVHVSKNGRTATVPVTIGGIYGTTTQVTKGLSAGDEVVVTVRSFGGTGTTRRSGAGTVGRGAGFGAGTGFGGGSGFGGGFGSGRG